MKNKLQVPPNHPKMEFNLSILPDVPEKVVRLKFLDSNLLNANKFLEMSFNQTILE